MVTKRKDPKDYLKMGQPTLYTKELADRICHLISTHPSGLDTLIKQYELPPRQTIYNWLNTYPDFFDKYMLAKQQQAHVLADHTLEVSNTIPTYTDKDGNEKIDNGMLGRAKLQMQALIWSAGKLAPKYYGEKAEAKNESLKEEALKHSKEIEEKYKKEY